MFPTLYSIRHPYVHHISNTLSHCHCTLLSLPSPPRCAQRSWLTSIPPSVPSFLQYCNVSLPRLCCDLRNFIRHSHDAFHIRHKDVYLVSILPFNACLAQYCDVSLSSICYDPHHVLSPTTQKFYVRHEDLSFSRKKDLCINVHSFSRLCQLTNINARYQSAT